MTTKNVAVHGLVLQCKRGSSIENRWSKINSFFSYRKLEQQVPDCCMTSTFYSIHLNCSLWGYYLSPGYWRRKSLKAACLMMNHDWGTLLDSTLRRHVPKATICSLKLLVCWCLAPEQLSILITNSDSTCSILTLAHSFIWCLNSALSCCMCYSLCKWYCTLKM